MRIDHSSLSSASSAIESSVVAEERMRSFMGRFPGSRTWVQITDGSIVLMDLVGSPSGGEGEMTGTLVMAPRMSGLTGPGGTPIYMSASWWYPGIVLSDEERPVGFDGKGCLCVSIVGGFVVDAYTLDRGFPVPA